MARPVDKGAEHGPLERATFPGWPERARQATTCAACTEELCRRTVWLAAPAFSDGAERAMIANATNTAMLCIADDQRLREPVSAIFLEKVRLDGMQKDITL